MLNHESTLHRDDAYRGRAVAKPTGLTVRGLRDLEGSRLRIAVKFETYAWEDWDARRVDVVPRGALVTVRTQRTGGRDGVSLGWCEPHPESHLSPSKEDHEGELQFIIPLTYGQMEQLEELRSGGDLRVELKIAVELKITGDRSSFEMTTVWVPSKPVPDKEWTTALTAMGFDEHVWIDVPIPRDAGPGRAARVLRKALEARTRGHRDEAVRECRVALDAVDQWGFAGRAPSDVFNWIKTNGKNLTMRERVAVLRAAAHMLFSPAHHVEGEDFSRKFTTASVSVVAAVIALIEDMGPEPKP